MTNHEQSQSPALLTRESVAGMLSLSTATVDRLIASGALKAVRIGRAVRVRHSDFDKYVKFLAEVR